MHEDILCSIQTQDLNRDDLVRTFEYFSDTATESVCGGMVLISDFATRKVCAASGNTELVRKKKDWQCREETDLLLNGSNTTHSISR